MGKFRQSKDEVINNEGIFLLEICKSNNLFMLNGRCGKDRGIGSYIFKETSVIDYSIVSAQALKFIYDFDIMQMDPLFTDHHWLLKTTLNFEKSSKTNGNPKKKKVKKRPKWHDSKTSSFIQNF